MSFTTHFFGLRKILNETTKISERFSSIRLSKAKSQSIMRQLTKLIVALMSLMSLAGCASNIQWKAEPQHLQACLPDHAPTWEEFTKSYGNYKHSAQTAVAITLVQMNPPLLQARFDPERSWVQPQIVEAWYPYEQSNANRLLRHEQLHFAITCLLVRQANQTLKSGDDPRQMLQLVRATAQRLNRQYDEDTNHGTIPVKQAQWEQDVEDQLEEVTELRSPNHTHAAAILWP